jgi:hypothetical protein
LVEIERPDHFFYVLAKLVPGVSLGYDAVSQTFRAKASIVFLSDFENQFTHYKNYNPDCELANYLTKILGRQRREFLNFGYWFAHKETKFHEEMLHLSTSGSLDEKGETQTLFCSVNLCGLCDLM